MIEGVLIDFYGTISGGDRDAVERASQHVVQAFDLPLSAGEFAVRWGERFFDVIDESNHERFQTLLECERTSLSRTLRDFGVAKDGHPSIHYLESYWTDPPVYSDALEFLRGLSLPVCCVSNADTEPLMTAIGRHRLRFDAVVTSEFARCYKPATGIFSAAIDALGLPPERLVHIGDSLYSDVAGAAKAGLATVWLCRDSRIHDRDAGLENPDFIISRLTDASEILCNTS